MPYMQLALHMSAYQFIVCAVKCAVYEYLTISSCVRGTLFCEQLVMYDRCTLCIPLLFIPTYACSGRMLNVVKNEASECSCSRTLRVTERTIHTPSNFSKIYESEWMNIKNCCKQINISSRCRLISCVWLQTTGNCAERFFPTREW